MKYILTLLLAAASLSLSAFGQCMTNNISKVEVTNQANFGVMAIPTYGGSTTSPTMLNLAGGATGVLSNVPITSSTATYTATNNIQIIKQNGGTLLCNVGVPTQATSYESLNINVTSNGCTSTAQMCN